MIGLMSVRDYVRQKHMINTLYIEPSFGGYCIVTPGGRVLEHFSTRTQCVDALERSGCRPADPAKHITSNRWEIPCSKN